MAAILRFDPFRDLQTLQARVNRLFDDVFGPSRPSVTAGEEMTAASFTPPVDLWETPEAYLVRVEIPGVTADQVKAEVANNTLVLTGERAMGANPKNGQWLRQEGSYGTFYRAIHLPAAVDADAIKARVQHGVLEVIVPKAEDAKAKLIPIAA